MKRKDYILTVDLLWNNRRNYPNDYVFDYPNYGDVIPKKVYNKYSSEVVDVLQNIWVIVFSSGSKITRKSQFAKMFKEELEHLGEYIEK